MDEINVRCMKDRNYKMIHVESIVVVNSRNREKKQFSENVRSIREVGLYKPIVVNKRNYKKLRKYELICGEGRLMAHKDLGKEEIKADVLDVDERTAHLMTLGENIARTPPATIEFARSIKEMYDYGVSMEELKAITGKDPSYLRQYIQLVENGEERLIKGVEEGVFSLSFAIVVAESNDRSIQHLLMDAFDSGLVQTKNLPRVRQIIENRIAKGKELGGRKKQDAPYTVDKLKRDIKKITKEKEMYVQQAGLRENRATRLVFTIREIRKDEDFMSLLQAEGLEKMPALAGDYIDA